MCQSGFSKGNVQFAYRVFLYIMCTSQNKYEEVAFVIHMLCVFCETGTEFISII
jgi:hypothetical protein